MQRGVGVKADNKYESWESSDFPILCEICFGDNPYVRMTKKPFAKACNACGRPMTEFRWKAGRKGRFKVTVVCQVCSRTQNVCQCCVHDLTYGVPVAVRNAIIKKYGDSKIFIPQSDVNLGYAQSQMLQAQEEGAAPGPQVPVGAHAELMRIKQSRDSRGPDYSRNLPKYCTFTSKGEDVRGAENPYRTEPPPAHHQQEQGKGIQQSIRDRFFGVDDAHAESMLKRQEDGGLRKRTLEAPNDPEIKSLWVGGVRDSMDENDLRQAFQKYGEITRIHIVSKSSCAFVEFATRALAEQAAADTQGVVSVKGELLRVDWSRSSKPESNTPASSSVPATGTATKEQWLAWQAQYQAWQQQMQQMGYSVPPASYAMPSNNGNAAASTGTSFSSMASVPHSSNATAGSSTNTATPHQNPPLPSAPPLPTNATGATPPLPTSSMGTAPPLPNQMSMAFVGAHAAANKGAGGPARRGPDHTQRRPGAAPYYPSMDPSAMGSRMLET